MHDARVQAEGHCGEEAPSAFGSEAIGVGARHYAENCAMCHGAPGTDPEGNRERADAAAT
ncbi:MAG TPA: hypothetical protein VGA51_00120 [Casimicrobiaceae bacterium]